MACGKCCCGDGGEEILTIDAAAAHSEEARSYLTVEAESMLPLVANAETIVMPMKFQPLVGDAPMLATQKCSPDTDGAGRLDFTGAWQDSSEKKHVHVITDTALKWSNNTITNLSFSGAQLTLIYNGSELTARINENGAQLQWSDGDLWNRAGFEGFWNRANFNGSCAIAGSTLTAVMMSQKSRTVSLLIVSPTSFSIELNKITYTATLDAVAMVLNWSDGDVWTRALLKDTTFNRWRGT